MAKKDKKPITCIYHKGEGKPSKEHLVQRALGGNLTRDFVCQKCNTDLSKIDQELVERSFISFSRVAKQAADADSVKLGGQHYWVHPAFDEAVEVEVGFGLKSKMKPSLLFDVTTGRVMGAFADHDDVKAFCKAVREHIAKGKLKSVPLLDPPDDQEKFRLCRLTLHRGDEFYLRFPSSIADREKIKNHLLSVIENQVDAIESQLLNPATPVPQQKQEIPSVILNTAININKTHRAIAKLAFNMLAYQMSVDFVLQAEFDSIRDYIVGKDVRDIPATEDFPAHDPRFVRRLPPDADLPFPRAADDEHLIIIQYIHPNVVVGIDFYGQNYYLVECGAVGVSHDILHCHVFDFIKKTNRPLDIHELADRIKTLFSSSI